MLTICKCSKSVTSL